METNTTLDTFSNAADGLAGGLVDVVSSLGVVGIGIAAAMVGYRLVKKILSRLA